MSLIWDKAPCSGNELLVLLSLADWANDGGFCWPSVPSIAAKCRLSDRGVRKIISRLCENGLVTRHCRRGRNHTNHYYINLNTIQVLPDQKPELDDTKPERRCIKPEQASSDEPSRGTTNEPKTPPPRGKPRTKFISPDHIWGEFPVDQDPRSN